MLRPPTISDALTSHDPTKVVFEAAAYVGIISVVVDNSIVCLFDEVDSLIT